MNNFQKADISGAFHMCTTAELHAHFAHFHNAHSGAVFFIEHGRRAGFERIFERADFRFDIHIFADHLVGDFFNPLHFLIADFGKMGEVEPQSFRRNLRTGLLDVVSQYRFECRLQDVRAGMVGGNGFASFLVNNQFCFCADIDCTLADHPFVHDEILDGLFRIFDGEIKSGSLEITGISGLTSGFSVKRRIVQNDFRLLSFTRRFHRFAVNKYRPDFRIVFFDFFITAEFRDNTGTGNFEIAFSNRFFAAAPPGAAGSFALRFHFFFKAFIVQRKAVALDDIRRQIRGEAVSVVEFKNQSTREDRFTGFLQRFRFFIQDAQTRVERFHKTLFFI